MKNRSLLRIATVICFIVSVLFLGQISVFADEIRPIHEYKFDGESNTTVIDSGKNKIDGSSSGANHETFYTGFNGMGKARYFNGIDDKLFFQNAFYKQKGAMSIRFKIKKDNSTFSSEKIETIITSGAINSGYFIGIGSDMINKKNGDSTAKNGSLYISYYNQYADKSFEIQTPESVCDGQWHDILFTWDGTTSASSVKLYLDNMATPIAQATPLFGEAVTMTYLGMGSLSEDWYNGYLDDVQIYDSAITPGTSNPGTSLDLKAIGGNSKVDLSWNSVTDASSYTIKRSTTAGGPYTAIATGVIDTTYTDTDVTNGITYYYIVTATINGNESMNSNEASATPEVSVDPEQPSGNQALLEITMVTGERKEYEMTMEKINDFIAWYNSKAASSPTYMIVKNYNKASFISRKDYIAYDQISNFEVNGYNN